MQVSHLCYKVKQLTMHISIIIVFLTAYLWPANEKIIRITINVIVCHFALLMIGLCCSFVYMFPDAQTKPTFLKTMIFWFHAYNNAWIYHNCHHTNLLGYSHLSLLSRTNLEQFHQTRPARWVRDRWLRYKVPIGFAVQMISMPHSHQATKFAYERFVTVTRNTRIQGIGRSVISGGYVFLLSWWPFYRDVWWMGIYQTLFCHNTRHLLI